MKNWIIMTLGGLVICSAAAIAGIDQTAQKIETVVDEDMAKTEQNITQDTQEAENTEKILEEEIDQDVRDLEGAHATLEPSPPSLSNLAEQMPKNPINLRETYVITPPVHRVRFKRRTDSLKLNECKCSK